MTKEQLAQAIYDALKPINTVDYVSAEDGDLSSVVIDGRFDLLGAAEAILRATGEPRDDLVHGERAEAIGLLRLSWAVCVNKDRPELANQIIGFIDRLALNRTPTHE